MTIYYLNERLVDKKDIPPNAVLIRRVKTKKGGRGWRGLYDIIEKYYEVKKG